MLDNFEFLCAFLNQTGSYRPIFQYRIRVNTILDWVQILRNRIKITAVKVQRTEWAKFRNIDGAAYIKMSKYVDIALSDPVSRFACVVLVLTFLIWPLFLSNSEDHFHVLVKTCSRYSITRRYFVAHFMHYLVHKRAVLCSFSLNNLGQKSMPKNQMYTILFQFVNINIKTVNGWCIQFILLTRTGYSYSRP